MEGCLILLLFPNRFFHLITFHQSLHALIWMCFLTLLFLVGEAIRKLAPSQSVPIFLSDRQTIVCLYESCGFLSFNPYTCTYYFCFYNHAFILFFLFSFASIIVIIYNVLLTICLAALAGKTFMVKYEDCSRTTMRKSIQSKSSNLMNPQDSLREFSKVFDLPPIPRSLGDIRQHQPRKQDF